MPSVFSMLRRLFHHDTESYTSKPAKDTPDAFLTQDQRAAEISDDATLMAEADDKALSEAIQASLHASHTVAYEKQAQAHAYFANNMQADRVQGPTPPQLAKTDLLSQQQIGVMDLGNTDLIDEANKDALEMGMRISASEMAPPTKRMRSLSHPERISPEEIEATNDVNKQLRTWFTENNLKVVRNGGGASNNCLLISLLQHAKKDYSSEHLKDANKYKALLVSQSRGTIGLYSALFEDSALMVELINKINQDCKSDIRVQFYTGNDTSEPGVGEVGTGNTPVIIFNQAGHFEAVIPAKKR